MTASTLFPAACAIARVPQKVEKESESGKCRVRSAECHQRKREGEEPREREGGVKGHEVAAAIVTTNAHCTPTTAAKRKTASPLGEVGVDAVSAIEDVVAVLS